MNFFRFQILISVCIFVFNTTLLLQRKKAVQGAVHLGCTIHCLLIIIMALVLAIAISQIGPDYIQIISYFGQTLVNQMNFSGWVFG